MAQDGSFLLRGDDGQLYRINKQQMAAFKVPANDPANQATPTFAQATAQMGLNQPVGFMPVFSKPNNP